MIRGYDDYGDFLREAQAAKLTKHARIVACDAWYGHETYSLALTKATIGDDSNVPGAEALLDSLSEVDYGEVVQSWGPSLAGAYPVVPEFLAGHPLCMRNRIDTEERSPARIFACCTISSKLSPEQLTRRGCAILALILKLQKTRPADLYVTAETHGRTDGDYIQVIPIESHPLSIAHASYALTSPAFARHLTHSVARMHDGFNGAWGNHYSDTPKYEFWLRRQLNLTDNDIYVKPGHVDDPLISSPVNWINEQLDRLVNSQESVGIRRENGEMDAYLQRKRMEA